MLISIDWIKDFVDITGVPPAQLRERFTRSVAEIEGMEEHKGISENICVAEIKALRPHPNADKLHLVSVHLGGEEYKEVVCGASNVRVGLKSPYAPVGATLPNGFQLTPKDIRGVISEGMLCSEFELGHSQEAEGIMELAGDAPVGVSLQKYFEEVSGITVDIENKSLTHRPDLWGHWGLAREFAAVFGKKLKNPFDKEWTKKQESLFTQKASPVKPLLEGNSSCLAYYGLSLEGIVVDSSPTWMKRRLKAVGLRSINNIVDISNYVMMELGIPLHIFDRDKIEGGKLIIKRLGRQEVFQTLDGQERTLQAHDTVICDSKRPLALAAIMGGLGSSVSENTTSIFIEVANWKAQEVRKTSSRLGLRTDSSERYEKSLDSLLCYPTLLRVVELVKELCPKAHVIGKAEYDGGDSERKKTVIQTSPGSLSKALGITVSKEKIVKILQDLGFSLQEDKGVLLVEVPSWRATKDIELEADLVEEIGRIIGYDSIAPVPPQVPVRPVKLRPLRSLERNLKKFLSCHGYAFEVMTHPLVGRTLLEKAHMERDAELTLVNALSKQHDCMRPSLIPSMLETLQLNAKNYSHCRFFEWGRAYKKDPRHFCREHHQLIVVFYCRERGTFMELVNVAERAFTFSGIPAQLVLKDSKLKNSVVSDSWPGLHPFEFYNIRIMGKVDGVIFSLHPAILKNFKIKGYASMMIADFSDLENKSIKKRLKYKPLPKYPSSTFDYCLEVDTTTTVGEILACLKKIPLKELVENRVVGIYDGGETKKYVTMRSLLFDETKTLSGESLKEAEETIVHSLHQSGYPLKKGHQ